MTATDDAVARILKASQELSGGYCAKVAAGLTPTSKCCMYHEGYEDALDAFSRDREGLMAALGLKQVGWVHGVDDLMPMCREDHGPFTEEHANHGFTIKPCECPYCKPVFTLEEQP